jgi:UDP-3-O-[3-hydroxymyristoyl] glucosamine N-acyltransferase
MADKSFFNLSSPRTIKEIAIIGECNVSPSTFLDKVLTGVASMEVAGSSEITFLSNPKYEPLLATSRAGACILSKKYIDRAPDGLALLVSENPYASYAKIASAFYSQDALEESISPIAVIDKSARIGNGCEISAHVTICREAVIGSGTYLAPGVYIGRGVKIGSNCRIGHGATLSHCIVGDNVIIHSGVRIGQDGFGFASKKGVHIKVPQIGRVVIGSDVEIGANSCIDRGAGPDTMIGDGTKIDNLVQIGHNVQIGKGCIIVSQVGIAGSTKIGDYVVLGGQVGIAGHLNIGSMVTVAAQSGVAQDIKPNQIFGGSPSVPIKQWHRQTIALKKLVANKRDSND